ncbi:MAG TPA: hypothetical protein GXZ91_00140 [Christensenellaceae bacterium]|jgi:hypothetical protein|nr:hypothetical protein [Christensenellaceae bacterium]
MSYCVHCGVETDEKSCPLCATPIIDPNAKEDDDNERRFPYPDTIDELYRKVDMKYARRLALIVLAVPVLVVLIVNLLSTGIISWSLYVIGALICLYTWFLVPVFYRFKRPYAYLFIGFSSLILYLYVIARMNDGGGWYLGLALPIIIVCFIVIQLILLAVRRLEWQPLERAAAVTSLIAISLIAIDWICDAFTGQVFLNWSIYALLPLMALAGVFLLLERKKELKEEIRKRLFF